MAMVALAPLRTVTTPLRIEPDMEPAAVRQHILVVDDENGPRQALRMLLKESYVVHLACGVATASEILEEEPISLIITDVRMPQGSGIELLREAKRAYPDVQVIILTGYGELDSAMKAVEYGAFAYLEKPFDNDALTDLVSSALEHHEIERTRRAFEYLALEANQFEMLGRVVVGMLHDLGSPLTVIGTHLEVLMANPKRSDAPRRLETMYAQVLHCGDLVRSTMSFLRCDKGPSLDIDINQAVESCLEVGNTLLREMNVCVNKRFEMDLPPIRGDLSLVRQAILNLVTNACQAMDGQPERRELTVETWSEEGGIFLAVRDTGSGIREKDYERVFDTFYTTKKQNGTGLGLSVVKNVMRRLNGTVALAPSTGGGASFVLQFPASTH